MLICDDEIMLASFITLKHYLIIIIMTTNDLLGKIKSLREPNSKRSLVKLIGFLMTIEYIREKEKFEDICKHHWI